MVVIVLFMFKQVCIRRQSSVIAPNRLRCLQIIAGLLHLFDRHSVLHQHRVHLIHIVLVVHVNEVLWLHARDPVDIHALVGQGVN